MNFWNVSFYFFIHFFLLTTPSNCSARRCHHHGLPRPLWNSPRTLHITRSVEECNRYRQSPVNSTPQTWQRCARAHRRSFIPPQIETNDILLLRANEAPCRSKHCGACFPKDPSNLRPSMLIFNKKITVLWAFDLYGRRNSSANGTFFWAIHNGCFTSLLRSSILFLFCQQTTFNRALK